MFPNKKGYDELILTKFSAGYVTIITLPSLSANEKAARFEHFLGLMYLVTQFAWPAVWEFHTASLFEIECGRARWEDSINNLDLRLLRNSSKSLGSVNTSRVATFKTKNVLIQKITTAPSEAKQNGFNTFAPNVGQFLAFCPNIRNFLRIVL